MCVSNINILNKRMSRETKGKGSGRELVCYEESRHEFRTIER